MKQNSLNVRELTPRSLVQKIVQNRSARDLLVLTSANALSQGLKVIAIPVLARIYAPGDFGISGAFFAWSMILSTPMNGRYDFPIVTAKDRDEIHRLVIVNIVSIFLMGILYWIVLYGSPLKTTVLLKDLAGLLGYTIPFVAVNNLCEVTTALANWEKNYRLLSTATFVRGSCTVGFQIFLGLLLPTAGSLVIGRTVGDLSFVVLLLIVRRKDWRLFLSPISLHDIVHTAVQYKRYPLYTIPSEWAQKASTELPTWLILLAFGDTIAGYYNITTRILTGPASLLVAGIRAFMFRKYAEVWSQGRKIDQVFAKSVALLFLVFFAVMFVAFIFAPQICDIFLGKAWTGAVPYLRILAPLTLVSMLVGATGMIVHVLKLQRFLMAWSILALFATMGVLLLGFVIHDPLLVIGLMAGSNFGIYLIYIGYTLHASQRLDPLNSYQPI